MADEKNKDDQLRERLASMFSNSDFEDASAEKEDASKAEKSQEEPKAKKKKSKKSDDADSESSKQDPETAEPSQDDEDAAAAEALAAYQQMLKSSGISSSGEYEDSAEETPEPEPEAVSEPEVETQPESVADEADDDQPATLADDDVPALSEETDDASEQTDELEVSPEIDSTESSDKPDSEELPEQESVESVDVVGDIAQQEKAVVEDSSSSDDKSKMPEQEVQEKDVAEPEQNDSVSEDISEEVADAQEVEPEEELAESDDVEAADNEETAEQEEIVVSQAADVVPAQQDTAEEKTETQPAEASEQKPDDEVIGEEPVKTPEVVVEEPAVEEKQQPKIDAATAERIAEKADKPKKGFFSKKSKKEPEESKEQKDEKSDDHYKKSAGDKVKDFFASASALIGVDIGFSSVKLVQLNYSGKNVTLGGFGYKKIPFEIRAKDKVKDDFIVRSIRDLMREQGMNALNAVTVVTGQGVSINSLLVPKMGMKELKSAAALELKKTVHFDLKDAVFDYMVGGEVFDRGGSKVEIVAVAVQKSIIHKKLELIERAGLKPVQILITPFALANVIEKAVTLEEEEVIAVADIGSRFTTISFYKDGKLQFAREISTAGDHITQSMVRTITTESGRITVTIEEAERLKAKWGIPTKKDAESDEAKQEVLAIAQIAAMMRPVLERLMTEVKRSINYYRQAFKATKISRLFITGGSSRLRNLKEYFSRNLVDVKIEALDTLNIISGWTDPQRANQELLEDQMPNLAIAFGTSLSKKPKMNLMPIEAKIQQKIELVKFALHVSVPVVTLILLVFYATFYTQVAKYRKLVDSAKFHIEKLKPTVEKIQDYDRMRQAIEERKALLERAVGRQPLWSGILKELSLITPEGVILSRMSIMPGTQPLKIRLQGDIYPTYTSIDLALSQFMITLDESPFFTNVELIATTRDPYSVTPKASFELVCKLIY